MYNLPSSVKKLPPLSPTEIGEIERRYSIVFPRSLREMYSEFLPCGEYFPAWNDFSDANTMRIRQLLDAPLKGLTLEVFENGFWLDSWGEKPSASAEISTRFGQIFAAAPKLIPVYSHRYLPYLPDESDPAVISVVQSDIIYYGENLRSYLENEFGDGKINPDLSRYAEIPFWSEIIVSR